MAGKYLRNSRAVAQLDLAYDVDPSDPEHDERLVQPICKAVGQLRTDALLEMHRHQPGSATPGTGDVKIQRGKSEDTHADMWRTFATLVHEYIHTLAPVEYYTWVDELNAQRRFTLTEGITDALTRIVMSSLTGTWAKLKERVAPGAYPGTYKGAADRAERMIGLIGAANAYAGYFSGEVGRFGELEEL